MTYPRHPTNSHGLGTRTGHSSTRRLTKSGSSFDPLGSFNVWLTCVFRYFKDIVDSYDLAKHMKLRHAVKGAYWDEKAGQWEVHVEDLTNGTTFVDRAEVLINGSGLLKYDCLSNTRSTPSNHHAATGNGLISKDFTVSREIYATQPDITPI